MKPLEYFESPGIQRTDYSESHINEDSLRPWEHGTSEPYHRYSAMMRNFAELVRGKENPYSYDYELNLYKLILRSCGKEV